MPNPPTRRAPQAAALSSCGGLPRFGDAGYPPAQVHRRDRWLQRADGVTFIRNSRGDQAPAATPLDAARLRGMLAAAPR